MFFCYIFLLCSAMLESKGERKEVEGLDRRGKVNERLSYGNLQEDFAKAYIFPRA